MGEEKKSRVWERAGVEVKKKRRKDRKDRNEERK